MFYTRETVAQPDFGIGIHFVLIILILLNARQNLHPDNYARILEAVNLDESKFT